MSYVITCGDEGVQINEGRRLGLVGAGIKLEHNEAVFAAMNTLFGLGIRVAASAENDWIKQQFELGTYEQADATMQQQAEALADKNGLLYSGFLPFSDPQDLQHDVRGHMVRPKGVHIANKMCFTLAGGEQVYSLGNYLMSAEWIHLVEPAVAQAVLKTQMEFYTKLAGQPLQLVVQLEGELGPEIAERNRQLLLEWGILSAA